jgi:VCBS repeat-containing protein
MVTGVETFIFNGASVAAGNLLNVAPDAGARLSVTGLIEDGASTASGDLLANATDANSAITPGGDVLAIKEVSSATLLASAVQISGDTDIVGKFGTLTVHADGTYDYVLRNNDPDTQALAPGQTVQDVFNFRVEDLQGVWDTAEFNFGITGSNDAPAGTDKTITILEDGAHYTFSSSDFGFLDAEGNALQSVIITSLPGAGTLTLNGVAVSLNDTIAATAIGTLVFTPATNANGSPYGSFGFKVVDDGGTVNSGHDTDATANTIRFDVTSVNDAPVITSNNGDPLAVNVNENSVSVTTIEAGDVDGTVGYALSGADAALFDISSTGVVTFIAAPDFETPKDTGLDNIYDITVVASDGSLTDTQDLTVTVNDIDGNTIAGTSSGNTIDATHKIGGKGATNEEDRIDGKAGDDTIKSGGGNDTLIGGTGKDVLTGGGGADKFVFNAKLGSTNIDTLKDFAHDIDLIQLDDKIFSKIGPSLSDGEFYAKSGAVKAHDKSDRIIYDTKTGKLYYDDDGAGGHAAVQFATLSNKPTIDHGDFVTCNALARANRPLPPGYRSPHA